MTIIANTTLNSHADMIAAIRAMQIELGRPVCSAIDDQSIGQQVVLLQKYLSTVPAGTPSGFVLDPASVRSSIADYTLPAEIIRLQTAIIGGVARPGFYNFTGANLSNWSAALAAQIAGTSDAIVGSVGNSTTAGQGSTGNGTASNAKSQSYPTQLANLVNGSWGSSFSDNNVTAVGGSVFSFDTRLATTNWVADAATGGGTAEGGFIKSVSPNTDALSFTPADSFDTIEVWYVRAAANGIFTVDVDGGAVLQTVDTSGTNAIGKATINCTLGTHTINFRRTTANANPVYITGFRVKNSTAKKIIVQNHGGCNFRAFHFQVSANPWNALPALGAYGMKLCFFEAGIINDCRDGNSFASVNGYITTFVNAMQAGGCDVILTSAAPSNTNIVSNAQQASYVANMKALAYTLGRPFIDVWQIFGGAYNAALMFDDLHENAAGYGLVAANLAVPVLNPAIRAA